MNTENLRAYHKNITDTYDERSGNHDKSEWHRKAALRLVEELPPRPGDSVLDVGTGTGTIAFHAASLVGPHGKVIGVDLSKGMLTQANGKLAVSNQRNLEFVLSDAENLGFPESSFDRIYCASAFFCILDPAATLRHWHDLLGPGGGLGFHALPETSYVWVSVARDVLARHGIPYVLNTPTGTIDKSRQLLIGAGFDDIDIWEETSGYFIPLEKAKKAWIQQDHFAPGQYPHPVSNVPPEVLAQCQLDYETRIEEISTDRGVWNDVSMYYIYARK
jgi:ubiquinone/menaquinone biosynthesis C-methylase UbiE